MRGHRLSEGSESTRVTRLSCCTVTRTVDRVAQSGESILQTSHIETFLFISFLLYQEGIIRMAMKKPSCMEGFFMAALHGEVL